MYAMESLTAAQGRHLKRGDALARRAALHPHAVRGHVQHGIVGDGPVAAHMQRLHALPQVAQQLRAGRTTPV